MGVIASRMTSGAWTLHEPRIVKKRLTDRLTDTTKNITLVIPLAVGKKLTNALILQCRC